MSNASMNSFTSIAYNEIWKHLIFLAANDIPGCNVFPGCTHMPLVWPWESVPQIPYWTGFGQSSLVGEFGCSPPASPHFSLHQVLMSRYGRRWKEGQRQSFSVSAEPCNLSLAGEAGCRMLAGLFCILPPQKLLGFCTKPWIFGTLKYVEFLWAAGESRCVCFRPNQNSVTDRFSCAWMAG